jgi:hypothetical protein
MSPPKPVEQGSVTHKAAATAMAASAALPPCLRMSTPMEDARGWLEATHPLRQTTGDRRDRKGISSTTDLTSMVEFRFANQSAMMMIFVNELCHGGCNSQSGRASRRVDAMRFDSRDRDDV